MSVPPNEKGLTYEKRNLRKHILASATSVANRYLEARREMPGRSVLGAIAPLLGNPDVQKATYLLVEDGSKMHTLPFIFFDGYVGLRGKLPDGRDAEGILHTNGYMAGQAADKTALQTGTISLTVKSGDEIWDFVIEPKHLPYTFDETKGGERVVKRFDAEPRIFYSTSNRDRKAWENGEIYHDYTEKHELVTGKMHGLADDMTPEERAKKRAEAVNVLTAFLDPNSVRADRELSIKFGEPRKGSYLDSFRTPLNPFST